MSRKKTDIQLSGYEDIFNDNEVKGEMEIVKIHSVKLYDFKNHPFQVADDDKMGELVQSIMQYGVLVPGISRPKADGTYEIVAGHRRRRACELAGVADIPMIVRNLTDDEATIIMVDSNIQREDLLPSEKAFAYRMKMEALKHQGKKGANTAKEVGEKAGDNERTVQRYIRLTYLAKELLDAVDKKKIALIAGSDLSFLNEQEEKWVLAVINESNKYPSGNIASKLKEYSKNKELTKTLVELLLKGNESESRRFVIKGEKIQEYFPSSYGKEEIENVIFSLLEEWKLKSE